jgi:acyl-CoA synthetase (AMP-forming)/AMP-acid ligase II
LLKLPTLRQAVVVAVDSRDGDRLLAAHIVPVDSETTCINAVRAHLEKELPHYMWPALIVIAKHLPVTPNGKIDRKTLREFSA